MPKRKRAPRGGLSRDRILEAALEIADSQGLEALTVRRLASAMGVSPMAIYGHFGNKSELVGGLLGRVIVAFEVTGHTAVESRDWVVESFVRMRRALLAHPGVIPLLGTGSSVSVTSVKVMQAMVSQLERLGCSQAQAVASFYAMLTFTIGSAHVAHGVEQLLGAGALEVGSTVFAELEPEIGGNLMALAPTIVEQGQEESFIRTLEMLCPQV